MNPVTNTGKPGGQSKTPQDINPRFVAPIAIKAAIAELIINGIAKIGLSTNGKPNTTGSLIPQIPGMNENFAIAL